MARSRTELSDQIGKAIGCRQDFNEYNSNLTTEIAAAGSGAVTASISRTLRYYSFLASGTTVYPKNVNTVLTGSGWASVAAGSIRDAPAVWHSTNHIMQNLAANDILDVTVSCEVASSTASIEFGVFLAQPATTGTVYSHGYASYAELAAARDRHYTVRIVAPITADAASTGLKLVVNPSRTVTIDATDYMELTIIRHPAPAAL